MTTSGPLDGVRVLDWTLFGVGPFAGSLLGVLGADVIKVEPPGGDPQAFIPPTIKDIATLYLNFNTNKRSMELDLKSDAGRSYMWKLIERSDVLINNMRPDVPSRLGFGFDACSSRNPDLVWVQSSGWGTSGPMAPYGGGDTWNEVFSGSCSITGQEAGDPESLRFRGHFDLNTSNYIVAAALAGLWARDRVGGQRVILDMLGAALAMQSDRLAEMLIGGVVPRPLGSAAAVTAPDQFFRGQDGAYVAVSAWTQRQWERLCRSIGRPDIAQRAEYRTNADRVSHRRALAAELQAVFEGKPVEWWAQQLARQRVPHAKLWDFDDIKYHPQVTENAHVVEIDSGRCGRIWTGGAPWRFSRSRAEIATCAYFDDHGDGIRAALDRAAPVTHRAVPPSGTITRPLDGLRVLELATGLSGPYCGSLFADSGATVTKVEPPEGDHLRTWGPPFVGDVGAAFVHLSRRKALRTIDGRDPAGREELRTLVKGQDVVIVDAVDPDGEPPPLSYDEIRRVDVRTVVVALSAYGERGPLARVPGSELAVQAMTNTWAGLGSRDSAPLRLGPNQAHMDAGVSAFQGALAALWERRTSGIGQLVSCSALGTLHSIKGMHWASLSGSDQWPGMHLTVWTDPPQRGTQTADGRILFQVGPKADAVLAELGVPLPTGMDPKAKDRWRDTSHPSHERWDGFWEEVLGRWTTKELSDVLWRHGGQVVPWMDYPSLARDPQVAVLGSFVEDTFAGHTVRAVRVPWEISTGDQMPAAIAASRVVVPQPA